MVLLQLCFLIQAPPLTKPVAFVKMVNHDSMPLFTIYHIWNGAFPGEGQVKLHDIFEYRKKISMYKRTCFIDSFKPIVINMGIE